MTPLANRSFGTPSVGTFPYHCSVGGVQIFFWRARSFSSRSHEKHGKSLFSLFCVKISNSPFWRCGWASLPYKKAAIDDRSQKHTA